MTEKFVLCKQPQVGQHKVIGGRGGGGDKHSFQLISLYKYPECVQVKPCCVKDHDMQKLDENKVEIRNNPHFSSNFESFSCTVHAPNKKDDTTSDCLGRRQTRCAT